MSTSPSWFDQEKFSRLVKKVGPKSAPEPAAVQPPPDPQGSTEALASTARISLVSKPPSLLSEHRALPALPRRTAPLPGLKSLFQYPPKDEPAPIPTPFEEPAAPPAPPEPIPKEEEKPAEAKAPEPKTEPSSPDRYNSSSP